jgi:hypothetical protein
LPLWLDRPVFRQIMRPGLRTFLAPGRCHAAILGTLTTLGGRATRRVSGQGCAGQHAERAAAGRGGRGGTPMRPGRQITGEGTDASRTEWSWGEQWLVNDGGWGCCPVHAAMWRQRARMDTPSGEAIRHACINPATSTTGRRRWWPLRVTSPRHQSLCGLAGSCGSGCAPCSARCRGSCAARTPGTR